MHCQGLIIDRLQESITVSFERLDRSKKLVMPSRWQKGKQVKPHLEKIWQGEGPDKMPSIRLDWSNDRHHEIVIQGWTYVDNVVEALLSLARLIDNDPNLKPCWKVTADHPVLARSDKFGMSEQEARAYADSLRPLGYENINVTVEA